MRSTDNPLLEVRNLQTTFETDFGTVPAVDGVSFEVNPGEIVGIVGESGSGKTVTALSIMGLIDPPGRVEADHVRFNGEDLLAKSEAEMRRIRGGDISMIFQDPMNSLNPVMTVGEQIAEVTRHHSGTGESTSFWREMGRKYVTGTNKQSHSWRRAIELLDTVGIPDPEKRAANFPHQFSGGMIQRVMIAQALAGDPSLVIADEPSTALDVSIEDQILQELLALRDEFGISILFITHDLGVIHEICDYVVVMYAGELMETAPVDQLFDDPNHPYTQGLLRSIPKLTEDVETLEPIKGSVPNPYEKPAGCPFRNRCPKAFDACDQPLVEYRTDSPDHTVMCHLYRDGVSPGRSRAMASADGSPNPATGDLPSNGSDDGGD